MLRRHWLFLKDLVDELGVAWSVARTHACERNGGHDWGVSHHDAMLGGLVRECKSCGCSASVPVSPWVQNTACTATSYSVTLTPGE